MSKTSWYMIPKDKLDKYKEIYMEEYEKEISDSEALNELTALVTFMNVVLKHQNNKSHE